MDGCILNPRGECHATGSGRACSFCLATGRDGLCARTVTAFTGPNLASAEACNQLPCGTACRAHGCRGEVSGRGLCRHRPLRRHLARRRVADTETGAAITAQTPVSAYSVNKPMTATVAMWLVEQGKLNLDRPRPAGRPPFSPRVAGFSPIQRHPGLSQGRMAAERSQAMRSAEGCAGGLFVGPAGARRLSILHLQLRAAEPRA